ncbi:protein translocase subunit SecD [Streptomyces sp. NBC_01283]|uniref:protein translocase subunit SecD n=1 Tax=Streptomyces sp. NBC_01283 TaxID=2903812 RepID=UPI00352BE346|nr:protein translocase subunit SecD [Streptomyces sp. NBC_01283]
MRALLALAAVVLSLYVALTVPVQLGLDLRGGTQLVLETRPATSDASGTSGTGEAGEAGEAGKAGETGKEATDRTMEVLRGRIDALGVAEPTIARSGDNRIVVELPGAQDPSKAADMLGRTAELTFHQVLGPAKSPADEPPTPTPTPTPTPLELPDESGQLLHLKPASLTGKDVEGATNRFDQQAGAGWHVTVDFRDPGGDDGDNGDGWARLTGEAACHQAGDPARRVAIVLDGKIISSPQVDPSVPCRTGISGGSTQITGNFSDTEARELALLISGGALPVPVEIIEQRTVGASLGEQAITASIWAAAIGAALTSLFIIAVYRLMGVLATVALAAYGLISYAALAAIGATLTLPGLAGFVLAIGMAVDANVLVFERAREEYAARHRPTPRSSLAAGFRSAFSAIADSNITTLIAAGLLFLFASGPVRGFGVTLGIGVLASMFSALVITRALADYAAARPAIRRRPALTGIAGIGTVRARLTRANPNLMRHPRRWLAASAAALVLATSGIALRGLDFGIEFTGGRLIEYVTETPIAPERARTALAEAGFPEAVVQKTGSSRGSGDDNNLHHLTVRTQPLTNPQAGKLTTTITNLTDERPKKLRDEAIGPSLGKELRQGALTALAIALAAQLAYLAARFRFLLGTAAVAALAHDVVILIGIFAWLGKPIDGVFLAALLTVIGYSVNDSVVVFDRIRELTKPTPTPTPTKGTPTPRRAFSQSTNQALLQTLPRTINTGMGAAFILTALATLGGASLTDFALALLIGLAVGTYSSMFTAAPLAIELNNRTKRGRSGRTAGLSHAGWAGR